MPNKEVIFFGHGLCNKFYKNQFDYNGNNFQKLYNKRLIES